MRILVIGQGGREHALVRALYFSPSTTEVHVAPGNPGMVQAIIHKIDISDKSQVLALCKKFSFDLVVIGPEQPLVDGLADDLRKAGVLVFGPSANAAQLEGSKIFTKNFLQSAGVPTAAFKVVTSVAQTLEAAPNFTPPYVLKADGLAGGKGVVICSQLEDLKRAAEDFFEKKTLGEAGSKAVLEQFMPGYELSFFVLTNGSQFEVMPLAQDHKRIGDGDTGPNTGGMGTVAPIPVPEDEYKTIIDKIVTPTVKHLGESHLFYRGVLFIGIMMTAEGPSVLEFNTRFGDPEAQVLLPLLDGDWAQTMLSIAKGEIRRLRWKNISTACVVMAAEGYPQSVVKNSVIEGDLMAQTSSSYIVHAGTDKKDDQWVVNGGRVLGIIGIGSSLREAIKKSYDLAETARWKGMQMRRDIGKKYL
ncbi:MAG: phosphoribosylamine--glycine ligase [Bdellovibrionales bacterium]|nr:phosphoribosylamine--glycine ligase [Bdellovibrionales bacterium]